MLTTMPPMLSVGADCARTVSTLKAHGPSQACPSLLTRQAYVAPGCRDSAGISVPSASPRPSKTTPVASCAPSAPNPPPSVRLTTCTSTLPVTPGATSVGVSDVDVPDPFTTAAGQTVGTTGPDSPDAGTGPAFHASTSAALTPAPATSPDSDEDSTGAGDVLVAGSGAEVQAPRSRAEEARTARGVRMRMCGG